MGKKIYQKRGNRFYFCGSWNIEYYEYDASGIKKRRRKSGFASEDERKKCWKNRGYYCGRRRNLRKIKRTSCFGII